MGKISTGKGQISQIRGGVAVVSAMAMALTGLSVALAPSAAAINDACTPTQTIDGAYVLLTFDDTTAACDWTVPSGVTSVHVLAVGGGGGGGAGIGGGGGGGGVLDDTGVSVTPNTTITVTVGAGGRGADWPQSGLTGAKSGGNSSFGGSVIAIGGGHGASEAQQAATAGGSGGGGGYAPNESGGAGTSGQGFPGGNGLNGGGTGEIGAGGGGGASSAGASEITSPTQSKAGGSGGAGKLSTISGTAVRFGGGGGGGMRSAAAGHLAGSGGIGGGGNGGTSRNCTGPCVASPGVDGLGGGGGGAAGTTASRGGRGGDGVVIVRYFSPALTPTCNVDFQELIFDADRMRSLMGNGRDAGDQVLFEDVSTDCGGMDALVTTAAIVDAGLTNYDRTPTARGGSENNFQILFNVTQPNGYLELTFGFFKAGTFGTPNQTPIILRNLQVTAVDTDGPQFAQFFNIDAYTVTTNTLLSVAPNPVTTFPSTVTFQSTGASTFNNPHSQPVVTYSEVETLKVRFGGDARFSGRFTGLAFRPLDWLNTTPLPVGPPPFTMVYDANGASSGSAPSDQSAVLGAQVISALNSGSLEREGYTFAGWALDDSTTTTGAIEPGDAYVMPQAGGTLYAAWLPDPVTLSYNANGGTGSLPPLTLNPDDTVVVSSATGFTKAGHTFTGWNTAADGSGVSYDPADMLILGLANETLYAQWTPVTYTLNYAANGGAPNATATRAGGAQVTVSSMEPTRTGFWFNGWSTTDDSTGTLYPAGSSFIMPASDDTLFAVWVPDTFNLTYNPNGGTSSLVDDSVTFGSAVTLPGDDSVVRAGYSFTGWNTAADGAGIDYSVGASLTMPAANTVIYVQWQANENALMYNGAGGRRAPLPQRVATDDTTNLAIMPPLRTGWAFTGWNTALNGSGVGYGPGGLLRMPTTDLTLFAQWIAQPQRLRYLPNAGLATVTSTPADDTALAGARFTISSLIPKREGYVFVGWNPRANGTARMFSPGAQTIMPGAGRTFHAQWKPNVYTITYNLGGASGVTPPNRPATFLEEVTLPNASGFTRPGYTFVGWDPDPGVGAGMQSGEKFTMQSADTTFFAQWQANPNTLAYDAAGGSSPPPAEQVLTDDTTTIATEGSMSRTGHWFSGWSTTPSASIASRSLATSSTGVTVAPGETWVMGTDDDTLHAQWVPDIYNLTFNANGGVSTLLDDSVTFGTDTTLPNDDSVTRAGYSLATWNTLANGTGSSYATGATFTMPSANTILYAQWTPATQTLRYNNQGGVGGPSDDTALTGDPITVSLDEPTLTGHMFAGWNRAANGTGAWVAASTTYLMPPNDDTLYAQWIAKTYRLIYEANDGDGAVAETSIAFNTQATVDSGGALSREGFLFTGWNTKADGTGTARSAGSTFTMPAESVTLYAQWTAQPQTLTYDANGGSGAPSNQSANTDDTVTLSATEPTRVNFAFVGWSTSPNGTGIAAAATEIIQMPPGGLTLYAQWVGIPFTLIYNDNGGSGGPGTESQLAGNPVTISSSTPVLSGFAFLGWNTATDGSGVTYASGDVLTMPAANMTLFAQWRSTTPPTPPAPATSSQPRSVTASALDAGARVSWTTPANPGSFPITSYRASATPGGQSCLVAAPLTACDITGLTNGVTYVIEVEALNGAGWSAPGRSNEITPSKATPGPGVVELPESVPSGGSLVLLDGAVETGVSVKPNENDNGLIISGTGWNTALTALDATGKPVALTPSAGLVALAGLGIQISGAGFLPESTVDVYVDPPVGSVVGASRSVGRATLIGQLRVDGAGRLSGSVTMPSSVAPGDHVLQLSVYTPASKVLAVNLGIRVSAWIALERGERKAEGRLDRVRAGGVLGGVEPGTRLTPWIRYSSTKKFTTGRATIRVQPDGTFRWTRKIRGNRGLAAYVSYRDTRSNRVYWAKVR